MPEESPKNGLVRLKIVSPVEEVALLEVTQVLLPGIAGDIMILPNRAPCFITLRAGKVVATLPDGKTKTFFISQGICEVRRNICPVLAWAIEAENIHLAEIKEQLSQEEQKLVSHQESGTPFETIRTEFFKMILSYFKKPV